MTLTELERLEAVVIRHLEVHNRLPAEMGFQLLAAIKELRQAAEAAQVSSLNVRKRESALGGAA